MTFTTTLTFCENPVLLRAVRGLPFIRSYAAGSIGPARVRITLSIGYKFLQCISNSMAGGKSLPIKVMPVAKCDDNQSEYLYDGLTGPVVVLSIQAMQSII